MSKQIGLSAEQTREENLRILIQVLERQIRGDIDTMRARASWEYMLKSMPHDDIAEALSMTLTHHNYQEASPRCCCGCRHTAVNAT
ncbi:hypothetical protein [Cupriavidus nantongensis]|uniref:hypothetical protein n=1 Tax=Cupriavidus nantongensis TaxID=1796606 RepID=UPI001237487F|nr:hypothetical protein [Cupriavidus nantongensis]